ncbi:hypothetical protein GR160_02900 [Flavobacterium sp. Sd200]|uniref:hypothetical protein n=1 Tax=Flavobacterium sp. Sd200 TaxID=2692211 RepID=UPI0013697047|nr:hypothetical protein [Flavobacterium sp. Sd200]MXN90162.1 hypothetical protein [Flavobacterium sp. Sd200]
MEFKTPSGSAITDPLATAGGAVAGAMLSKATVGLIHNPVASEDAETIKKDENALLFKRAGLTAVGLAAAMFITGKDGLTTAAKGAGIGIAVVQSLEIIKVLASRGGVTADPAASKAKKALANAVGLGCPCNGGLNASRRRRRQTGRLNAPVYAFSNMDKFAPAAKSLESLGSGGGLDKWAAKQLLAA